MKTWKGLLGAALLLCTVLCVTTITVSADDDIHTQHPICGATHTDIGNHTGECADVVWTAWDGRSAIPYDASNTAYIYLTDNVERTDRLNITAGQTLYLCLNGHSITSTHDGTGPWDAAIYVYNNAQFVLCDCKNNTGTITHSPGIRGRGIRVGDGFNAVFTMYGGTISGNHVGTSGSGNGAGVEIQNGIFTMYGGKITDNHVDEASSYYGGGGVCAYSSGKFIMYGGEISNNSSAADSGGVSTWGGTAKLYGGTISGNTAAGNGGGICLNDNLTLSNDFRIINNTAANGGGVYTNSPLTLSDNASISGNKATTGNGGGVYIEGPLSLSDNASISGNKATTGKGGGVYYTSSGGNDSLTLSDSAKISNNTAAGDGGGIYIDMGYLAINGGSLINNTATGNGGGVYLGSSKKFQISGNINIAGNKKGSNANNIYLPKNKTISIMGELTGTTPIGVTTEAPPDSSSYVRIASGGTEYADPAKFQYENNDTPISVVLNSSGNSATLVVCVHSWGSIWKMDSTSHWHECSICKGKENTGVHTGGTATCTEKAWCETCNLQYGNTLGHDFTGEVWQNDANHHWKKCSRCDAIDTTSPSPHVWDSGKVTTQPTCTTAGQKTYTCAVCSATHVETIQSSGHDISHHDARAATCTTIGWNAYNTCSRCNYTTYTEIAALGHDAVSHEGKAATCTEYGWKPYVTCNRCDYTTYRKINALGHDISHHDARAATCTEKGWNAYDTCSRCDYSTYEEIAALGHDEVSHEGKAATYTEYGWKPYVTCSRCDYTTYEKSNALGGDFTGNTSSPKTGDNSTPIAWISITIVCAGILLLFSQKQK